MNANELADALDWVCENHLVGIGDADFKATSTMLRQQQAEIEALKEKLMMEEESYMLLDEELLCAKESIKQQQAEIEALKALNKSIIDDPLQFMKIKAQEK
jgi:hypothetical protein